VLDLFSGIGGFSTGFKRAGFCVEGIDSERIASVVYQTAGLGLARQIDLGLQLCVRDVPVVIGGPPCRPWSAVNLHRRRSAHEDYGLLTRFVEHIREIRPQVFVMENVPALGSDASYSEGMDQLKRDGFDVGSRILHYHRFGACTRRRRLLTAGVLGSPSGASSFFDILEQQERPAGNVGQAIRWLRDAERGSVPDHDWSELRTIDKYRDRYESGKFGWMKLDYDQPAPSFGSVAKTYILHPEAGLNGFPERVLSVREVLAIMGFDLTVRFPERTARGLRYQMAANAVSPQVSYAIAVTVRQLLTGVKEQSEPDLLQCAPAA
jgi:DNA (cytosine-5)-methyltransferase 1